MRFWFVILAMVLAGCGVLTMDPAPAKPDRVAQADPPADAPVTDTAAAEPAPDASPSCTLVTRILDAIADTVLMFDPNACPGDLSYGDADGLNTKVGGAAIRFDLDADLAAALADGSIREARLLLDTNPFCNGCGAAGLPASAGALMAYPMRTDWDEGHATGKTGADGCRRTAAGAGWGTAKTASVGTRIAPKNDYATALAGVTAYLDGASNVEIVLSTSTLRTYDLARADAGASKSAIALYLTSSAMLILASREAHAPLRAPRLAITRCAS
jgi:hypothetical protein